MRTSKPQVRSSSRRNDRRAWALAGASAFALASWQCSPAPPPPAESVVEIAEATAEPLEPLAPDQPAEVATASPALEPFAPGELRATPFHKHRPRVRRLVLTEVANVERLLDATPKNDPHRPALMRRLAQGYVELSAAAGRARDEANTEPKRAKEAKLAKMARKRAVKYLRRLAKEYPKWCQFPGGRPGRRVCQDVVLYELAYQYEQAGELNKARKIYLQLVKEWPRSRYLPHTYLAFAELFLEEAKADERKWPVARQAYEKVTQFDPPDNPLYGYAWYKLGFVHWHQGNRADAEAAFGHAIRYGERFPQLPMAPALAEAAREARQALREE